MSDIRTVQTIKKMKGAEWGRDVLIYPINSEGDYSFRVGDFERKWDCDFENHELSLIPDLKFYPGYSEIPLESLREDEKYIAIIFRKDDVREVYLGLDIKSVEALLATADYRGLYQESRIYFFNESQAISFESLIQPSETFIGFEKIYLDLEQPFVETVELLKEWAERFEYSYIEEGKEFYNRELYVFEIIEDLCRSNDLSREEFIIQFVERYFIGCDIRYYVAYKIKVSDEFVVGIFFNY